MIAQEKIKDKAAKKDKKAAEKSLDLAGVQVGATGTASESKKASAASSSQVAGGAGRATTTDSSQVQED